MLLNWSVCAFFYVTKLVDTNGPSPCLVQFLIEYGKTKREGTQYHANVYLCKRGRKSTQTKIPSWEAMKPLY